MKVKENERKKGFILFCHCHRIKVKVAATEEESFPKQSELICEVLIMTFNENDFHFYYQKKKRKGKKPTADPEN